MADPSPIGPDRDSTTGMSRWVKVTLIILAVLVLLVVVMLLVGGGAGGHQIPQHAPPLGASWVSSVLRYRWQS